MRPLRLADPSERVLSIDPPPPLGSPTMVVRLQALLSLNVKDWTGRDRPVVDDAFHLVSLRFTSHLPEA